MTHEVRQGPTLRGEIIYEVASLILCLSILLKSFSVTLLGCSKNSFGLLHRFSY